MPRTGYFGDLLVFLLRGCALGLGVFLVFSCFGGYLWACYFLGVFLPQEVSLGLVFPWCSISVFSMFYQCFLGVLLLCSWCFLGVVLVFSSCFLAVFLLSSASTVWGTSEDQREKGWAKGLSQGLDPRSHLSLQLDFKLTVQPPLNFTSKIL